MRVFRSVLDASGQNGTHSATFRFHLVTHLRTSHICNQNSSLLTQSEVLSITAGGFGGFNRAESPNANSGGGQGGERASGVVGAGWIGVAEQVGV